MVVKNIWFTADTHFGHERILTFGSRGRFMQTRLIKDHDSTVLDCINKNVKSTDILYHLGDFCWSNPGHYRNRINCKEIHFIRGNHDRPAYDAFFSSRQDSIEIKYQPFGDSVTKQDRIKIWLSHYCHFVWPSSHYGSLHLYGHTHAMREDYLDKLLPDRRSMDVGVDNAYRLFGEYRPIAIEEIIAYLLKRKGADPLEFYKQFDDESELTPHAT